MSKNKNIGRDTLLALDLFADEIMESFYFVIPDAIDKNNKKLETIFKIKGTNLLTQSECPKSLKKLIKTSKSKDGVYLYLCDLMPDGDISCDIRITSYVGFTPSFLHKELTFKFTKFGYSVENLSEDLSKTSPDYLKELDKSIHAIKLELNHELLMNGGVLNNRKISKLTHEFCKIFTI